MRKWYKYLIDESGTGVIYKRIDQNYDEVSAGMGGYSSCESYINKEAFFNKYYFGRDRGRLEYYNDFLTSNLDKAYSILSVASGRCANELFLIDKGYKVTCSDLEKLPAYDETKRLFPEFEYTKLNILEFPAPRRFDALMCLSLIYLFDVQKLNRFFKNVSESLKMNGIFILDSAGSSDSLFSYFIHGILLKHEIKLIRILRFILKHKRSGLTIKHHGYFRNDREIIKSAKKFGLTLKAQKNYGGLIEFRRSVLFNKLVRDNSRTERIFEVLGKAIPYIRMFKFEKIR